MFCFHWGILEYHLIYNYHISGINYVITRCIYIYIYSLCICLCMYACVRARVYNSKVQRFFELEKSTPLINLRIVSRVLTDILYISIITRFENKEPHILFVNWVCFLFFVCLGLFLFFFCWVSLQPPAFSAFVISRSLQSRPSSGLFIEKLCQKADKSCFICFPYINQAKNRLKRKLVYNTGFLKHLLDK